MTVTGRLDAIEARTNAATEGPWVAVMTEQYLWVGPSIADLSTDRVEGDATFIAHARTDVPALVAALRAVLAVHGARERDLGRGWVCTGCLAYRGPITDDPLPCPTVAAITASLGVSTPPSTVQGTSKLGTNSGEGA